MAKKTKEKWKTSKSKALLRAGLLSGEITSTMTHKEVYAMHPEEHSKWSYTNWSNNLRNLRAAINLDWSRMAEDAAAYGHTLEIAKQAWVGKPFHRSDTFDLLKEDIDNEKHNEMSPSELWQSRDEYCNHFGLWEFGKHIYQEVDSRPKREIRYARKQKAWLYPELHKDHPRLLAPDESDNELEDDVDEDTDAAEN